MITHQIPGRFRIRTPSLTVSDTAREVEKTLKSLPGVTDTAVNLRTGSLLVLYDTSEIHPSSVPTLLERIAPKLPRKASRSAASKRAGAVLEKKIMLGLLPILIVLGFADAEKAHIYAGAAFAALAGHHVYERRKRLFN